MFSNFFPENSALYESVEKCGAARGALSDVTIWHLSVECWISKAIRTHAHEQAHAPWHPHAHVDTEKFVILFFQNTAAEAWS